MNLEFFIALSLFFVYANALSGKIQSHQASLFRVKCEMLPYRTMMKDSDCYFAVHKQLDLTQGKAECAAILPGSEIVLSQTGSSILQSMLLEPSDFNLDTTYYTKKGVLCRYSNKFACTPSESLGLPGQCLSNIGTSQTFNEAHNNCVSRDSRLAKVRNYAESMAVAKVLNGASTSAWIDHNFNASWQYLNQDSIVYNHWQPGKPSGCSGSTRLTATVIGSQLSSGCTAISQWEPAPWTDKKSVICSRLADSVYNPAEPAPPVIPTTTTTTTTKSTTTTTTTKKTTTTTTTPKPTTTTKKTTTTTTTPKPTTTTKRTTTTTTTRKPTTTTKALTNNAPLPSYLWTLRFYYNPIRVVHGYCSESASCAKMWATEINYDRVLWQGDLGKTLSYDGYEKMRTQCSRYHAQLKPLHFKRVADAYVHDFWTGIFVGYVAVVNGHCGASIPMKAWSCRVSADVMFGVDLEWNTFYKGLVRDNGMVHFYLW